MALRARERGVHARQRIARICRVIEGCIRPVDSAVADRAVLREACRHVRRIAGAVEFTAVAAVARRRQRCVVVVHVALAARSSRMRASEREACFRMVERCRAPAARGVALRAVLRESARNVTGIARRREILLVARITVGGRIRVIVI